MQYNVECHKCGAKNDFGQRYCIACGEKFVYKCPQCGTDIYPDYKVCPSCTTGLDWDLKTEPQTLRREQRIIQPEETEPGDSTKKDVVLSRKPVFRSKTIIWLFAFIIVILCIAAIFAIDILF